MKVTSEQLLKLFGLKVGDKVRVSMELGTTDFIVIKYENGWYKLRSKVNGREFRDNITFLLDKDYEIIKQTPKLSEDEKVILRNLDDEYNYIMRDEKLWVSKSKPDKGSSCWASVCKSIYLDAFPNLFKFITWEDEEPYNIKELLDE